MQNDFDLCRICGEGYCDCDILLGQEQYSGSGEKGEDDDEGRDYEEFDYDRPLFDEYNAPILFGEEGEGGDDDDADDGDWEDEEDLEQEIDKFINGDDNDNESGAESEYIEMNSVRPLVKSQEIFNIFGKLSNTCLLMRYGFSQSGNPFDVVNFTIDYFTDFLKTHWKDLSFGNKEREWDQDKIENRIKLWQLLRPFAQALEEENKEGEEEDGGGEQEEEEEDVSDDHGHCSSGNCSDHHHHGHAHDDEEEEEERPDPFALTLDVKGIPDSDLILFLAIMFASSRLLQAVSEDQDLAIQWVKQILHANSLQGDVVWKGTGAVWTVDNNNDGESDDLDDDNNNNVMVPSTVPSTTYQKIALALTLLAEHRLEKLGGNKEEDVMALNLLVRSDEMRERCVCDG